MRRLRLTLYYQREHVRRRSMAELQRRRADHFDNLGVLMRHPAAQTSLDVSERRHRIVCSRPSDAVTCSSPPRGMSKLASPIRRWTPLM